MNPSRYLDLFIQEAREHLELARGILGKLGNLDSGEQLHALFRHAHSLKGMAATMGFRDMTALAHALEDALETARDGGVNPRAISEGFEVLATMLRAVERGESPDGFGSEDVARRLRGPRGSGRFEPYRLRIELDDRELTPAVATMVVRTLERLGEASLVETSEAQLRRGSVEGPIRATIRSELSAPELERRLSCLDGVRGVSVEADDEPVPRTAPPVQESRPLVRVQADLLDGALESALDLMLEYGRLAGSWTDAPVRVRRLGERCDVLLRRLYRRLMELRLVPFRSIGERLAEEVERLADELGKPVDLAIEGPELRLDRRVLDALIEPLGHMLRNALDHGIEPPEERAARGKPERGSIRLVLDRRGDRAVVVMQDDGRGLDLASVRRVALERGLVAASEAARLSEERAWQLITLPGFSTATSVSHVSGRGVGMDVVRHAVEMLGGSLEIRSSSGSGTAIELSLPLTLALIEALIVRRRGELYAVPSSMVASVVEPANGPDHRRVPLADIANPGAAPEHSGPALMLDTPQGTTGLLVDEVLAQREIVVRPLAPPLHALRPFAGAALLEDGAVALVVDPDRLHVAA